MKKLRKTRGTTITSIVVVVIKVSLPGKCKLEQAQALFWFIKSVLKLNYQRNISIVLHTRVNNFKIVKPKLKAVCRLREC